MRPAPAAVDPAALGAARAASLAPLRAIGEARVAIASAQKVLELPATGERVTAPALQHVARASSSLANALDGIRELGGRSLVGDSAPRNALHAQRSLEQARTSLKVGSIASAQSALQEASIRARLSDESGTRSVRTATKSTVRRDSSTGNSGAGSRSDGTVWGGRFGEGDEDPVTGQYPRSAYDEYGEQVYPGGPVGPDGADLGPLI